MEGPLWEWLMKTFKNWPITQKQELPVTAMFVNGSGQNVQTL
jgi:hypothetical protein